MTGLGFTRVFTAAVIYLIGIPIIVIFFLFGIVIGPREPPSGVSWEEHVQRIDDGTYARDAGRAILCMTAYLALLLVPHRWAVKKTIRYRILMGLLLLPILVLLGLAVILTAAAIAAGAWKAIGFSLIIPAVFLCIFLPTPILLKTARDLHAARTAHTRP